MALTFGDHIVDIKSKILAHSYLDKYGLKLFYSSKINHKFIVVVV
jgi:hypothetical protein